MPAPSGERATLSRDLADFLIELSIALHKHAMYPEGHPSLAPAAAGVTRRAERLLQDRSTLSLGVARQQLVIEGVATDPKHPVLAELAGRLHRHHLGAMTFRRGVEAVEVAAVLKALAVDAERRGQPLGLGPPEGLRAWAHVQLHPLTYERLELVDDGAAASERGARAAQLWVGLARAALTAHAGDDRPTPTEPAVIARAIDDHPRTDAAAYDQVIVGYLLQIADELKTAGSADAAALRRRMSRAAPGRRVTPEGEHATEPDRIVAMALEVDAVNAHGLAAANRVVQAGRLDRLLDALAEVSESPGAAREVWARLATADVVRQLATQDPVDFKTLERLVPRVGVAAAAPLLDALAAAEARGVRRGLLAQLAKMGPEIAAIVVQRLEDARWYVTRNMLALLEELSPLPAGFSAAAYLGHPDARVRWQAVKVQVKLPDERDEALAVGLQDHDPRTLRLALGLAVALQSCPDSAVPVLAERATDRALPPDVRTLAVRALGHARARAALEALLRLASAGRTLFGREKLPPKSPELLAALAGLASGWPQDPRARAVLRRAAESRDPDWVAAADGGGRDGGPRADPA